MSNLIAIAYPDKLTAERVVDNISEARKGHLIELDDLVLVERRTDGKIKLHQPSLAGAGALGGAAWGGLIGLIFLVPLFGMAIGGAAGAAAGAVSDAGVDDSFLRELGAELSEGSVAVVALVRDANIEKLLKNVSIPGTVLRTSLDDDTEHSLAEALARAEAPA